MTALLISEIFPPRVGGSGRWLYEVYRRLPPGVVDVAVGTHDAASAFDALETLPIHRLPLNFCNWGAIDPRGWAGYWNAFWTISEVVKQRRITEFHCGRCLPEGWLALMLQARFRLPLLCYVHGEELPLAEQSRELRWMTRRVLARSRLLVANTHNTARLLIDRWQVPQSRVMVLHPGVDGEKFHPSEPSEPVRRRLGWTDRTVVLTVGRLQRRKGHDTLIAALPQIRTAIPDILYSIVGEGEERSRLESLARDHGIEHCVQFRGEPGDKELVECYQQCDLFVLPNREVNGDFEGFGMVLLEAQACGKAVIAGDSGGTTETMQVGVTGRIVPCEEPGPLGNAIVQSLEDREGLSRMGVDARRWVLQEFDWPSLCNRAAAILGIRNPEGSSIAAPCLQVSGNEGKNAANPIPDVQAAE